MKKGVFIYLLPIAALLFSNWSSRAGTAELLSNRDFEAGNISWTANTLSGSAAAGILQGSYPHTPGTWYGYVGNTTSSVGSLFQSFLVPYNAGIATVTFYLNVGSSETATVSKYDLMDVNFRTYPSDSLIWKFETFSNLDKAANGVYTKREYTYDLTSYRNQYVVLQFYGVNDADYITTFRIDDVSVSVDLVPAPQTPTGFSASATSSTITLSWNDGSGESDYEIHWATSSSGPWTLLGLAGQNGVTYQDNRASAGVNYWYRIRARSAVGNSAWSSSIPDWPARDFRLRCRGQPHQPWPTRARL